MNPGLRHSVLAPLLLASALFSQEGNPPKSPGVSGNVVPAAELNRKWNAPRTRGATHARSETRSTTMSEAQLAKIRAAGADRGIKVVPTANGQNEVSIEVDPGTAVAFPNILFKLDSTELADQNSAQQVAEIGQAMLASRGKSFLLEGHTCDLGNDEHNQGLSERRAAAILAILAGQGVAPSQLVPMGFGERQPVIPNASEDSRRQNRRVVISVQR
jgi:outer membrane protein OmpA-like peptidoglycan-associated protein